MVVLVLTGAAAWGQTETAKTDPASWAPADALVFVGVTDLSELTDSFKKTSAYKLTLDPAAKELPGEFGYIARFTEQFKSRLAKALDMQPDEMKNPFGGSAALFVAATADEKEPQVVAIAGVKDAELMKGYYAKASANFRALADTHEAVSFSSYTIDHFATRARDDKGATGEEGTDEAEEEDEDAGHRPSSSEEAFAEAMDKLFGELFSPDAMPENLALCLTDDRLIVSTTPDRIKEALRRGRGEDSLREAEDYKALGRHFENAGPLRFMVNLPRLFELMKAHDADEAKEAMTILGGECLRSFIGHVKFGDGELDARFEALVMMRGERTGLAKILSMKNREVTPPPTVSADSVIYASANLNPGEILDEVERTMRQLDPESAEEMHASLEAMPAGEGETVNFRREVIGNLTGPATFTLGFTKPIDAGSPRLTAMMGHRDKDALVRVVEKFKAHVGMVDRQLGGATVYDFPIGGMAIGFTSDAVIAGNTPAVEAAVQTSRDSEGLAGDAMFKKAAAAGQREAWFTMYVDGPRLFDAAIDLARQEEAIQASMMTNMSAMVALGIAQGIAGTMEKDKLEQTRRLGQYQTLSLFTISTTSDGLRLSQVTLPSSK